MCLKINFCCFCFPLRPGLLVWGYFALAMTSVTILLMLFMFLNDIFRPYDLKYFTGVVLLLSSTVVHFTFNIMLIVGLHKKSRVMLEAFFGYSVIKMIVVIIITSHFVIGEAYTLHDLLGIDIEIYIIVGITSLVITMILQLYLMIAVRSLISKLQDDNDCSSSVYHTNDPGHVMHIYKENDYYD